MSFSLRKLLVPILVLVLFLDLCVESGFSQSTPARDDHVHHHGGGCSHSHDHDHDHDHDHHVKKTTAKVEMKLPEELAEEEDMRLCGFGPCLHDHDHESSSTLTGFALWLNALGCSLLVSLASLICLVLLPIMFVQGKPSKWFVDSLALFGAGAMLGDAFLHQLPHAFGGGHSHSNDHHENHDHHDHSHSDSPSHSHSIQDLSVGLSVLAGIVVFLLVEKLVRYVEENSSGSNTWGHHHHHHHAGSKKLKDEGDHNNLDQQSSSDAIVNSSEKVSGGSTDKSLRKRKTSASDATDKSDSGTEITSDGKSDKPEQVETRSSSLVFGYLNLFSDGVHNFTDGMALGSAFLIYGSVGGWSRTMFLLAHELPQEIGDFGILVRSGFTVTKALFFNFLSALVALAGTALVLVWGNEPGQSSLIEVVNNIFALLALDLV
ncbi:Zinc/iron permease [Arabidopsis suecica]|jgi:zinc transporter 7|uniref:ZIP metal ion transporter family n=2 Tax=Arabidopsis TaxID=3701 RepID=A0A1P8ATB0_ARATH|nr:ZIP metal ion transporter family [Arabidopsis thaliana]ANM59888.1 ZIP metal ion transporter family [Arabidopsis thaliana]KAG7658818.1 Zinc/iron permease [Arabidopsis suecica]|eukprot:NP_001322211.1 ZIP metal ion transporter family [Arabidopsis thaliana]